MRGKSGWMEQSGVNGDKSRRGHNAVGVTGDVKNDFTRFRITSFAFRNKLRQVPSGARED